MQLLANNVVEMLQQCNSVVLRSKVNQLITFLKGYQEKSTDRNPSGTKQDYLYFSIGLRRGTLTFSVTLERVCEVLFCLAAQ